MSKNGVIIQGSSRSVGNTNKVVSYVAETLKFDVIDLNEKKIGPFDYDFKNSDDDFLPMMRELVAKYDTIIFATPVYWYSMSGTMKIFFDRITDLLRIEKEIGRKLRGKSMAMISCGSEGFLQEGFTMPFFETAGYLGMSYLGDVHTWILDDQIPEIVRENLDVFIRKIES